MNTAQKIIKYLALAFAFFIIVNIISGILFGLNSLSGVLGLRKSNNHKTESVEEISSKIDNTDIASLKIDINYSNLRIRKGDSFKVESDDKDVSCTQNGKQIVIKEKNHNWFSDREASELIVYVPESLKFEEVKIETGAGEIQVESLTTEELSFEIGAGTVEVNQLNVLKEAKIDGGAGKVGIRSGEIHNLDLDMGAGKFELTAKLRGKNDIDEGVGKLELNLMDGTENYKIKVSKGIGSITIDGKETQDGETYGDGENYIKIDGGVGAIMIK